MWSLKDLSDTKIVFRYIQSAHHKGHVAQTPKGLLKMQAKLDSFIKVAAPCPSSISRMKEINASWARDQAKAMQAHYQGLITSVSSNIADRDFSTESFEKAWSGALKWARSSFGRKLTAQTVDASKGACRAAALAKPATARPSASAQTLPGPSVQPSRPAHQAPSPTEPVTSQPSGDWVSVKYNRRTSQPQQTRAVSGSKDALSNFFPFRFRYRGLVHDSVEHAYHMEKAFYFGHRQAWCEIWEAPNAYEAKAVSNSYFKSRSFWHRCQNNPRLASLVEGWNKSKETLVLRLLRLKLAQCPTFAAALRESGTKGLLHNVLDPWWGTGSRDADTVAGRNVFGRLLEQVRFERFGFATLKVTREARTSREQANGPVSYESKNSFGVLRDVGRKQTSGSVPHRAVGGSTGKATTANRKHTAVCKSQSAERDSTKAVQTAGRSQTTESEPQSAKQDSTKDTKAAGRNQTTESEPHNSAETDSTKADRAAGRSQATEPEPHSAGRDSAKADQTAGRNQTTESEPQSAEQGSTMVYPTGNKNQTQSKLQLAIHPATPCTVVDSTQKTNRFKRGRASPGQSLSPSGSPDLCPKRSRQSNSSRDTSGGLPTSGPGVQSLAKPMDTPGSPPASGSGVITDRQRDPSGGHPAPSPGAHSLDLSSFEFPLLGAGSPKQLVLSSPSREASPGPPSPTFSEVVSEPSPLSSSRLRSLSQPSLTEFLGPKTDKLKFTKISSIKQGEQFVPFNVCRIDAPFGEKKHWHLPEITKSILVIGDSNLSKIKEVSRSVASKIQIISYPGAKFEHLYEILKKQKTAIDQVTHVVLSIGVNNRSQSATATANKNIKSLHFQATKTFRKAQICYPTIGNKFSSTSEMQNLTDFEGTWRGLKTTILPSLSSFQTTEGVHWTHATARGLLDRWLRHLKLN